MVTQAEVEKFIEVSGRAGILDRHSQLGVAIARELLERRARISALEAERDTLKERLEVTKQASAIFEENSKHCSEEFEKRLSAEKQLNKAVELLRTECLCYEFSAACSRCKQKHVFLASIGGEEK